jgi:hypothetical protein
LTVDVSQKPLLREDKESTRYEQKYGTIFYPESCQQPARQERFTSKVERSAGRKKAHRGGGVPSRGCTNEPSGFWMKRSDADARYHRRQTQEQLVP